MAERLRNFARLLAPARRDITEEYARSLAGLMKNPITLDALEQTCEEMIASIVGAMPDAHLQFLLCFQRGAPEWSLLEVAHAETLPAVRWQMMKLAILHHGGREELADWLEAALGEGICDGTTFASANIEE